MLKKLFD